MTFCLLKSGKREVDRVGGLTQIFSPKWEV
jgi:hypothetical protein